MDNRTHLRHNCVRSGPHASPAVLVLCAMGMCSIMFHFFPKGDGITTRLWRGWEGCEGGAMVSLLFTERLELGFQWAKGVSYLRLKPVRAVGVHEICFFLHYSGSKRARKEEIQCQEIDTS